LMVGVGSGHRYEIIVHIAVTKAEE
jgi:hypothetical protein